MHERSADTTLAETRKVMSELFDKEVNAQKRKTSRVHARSSKPTKKCAMKMKESK